LEVKGAKNENRGQVQDISSVKDKFIVKSYFRHDGKYVRQQFRDGEDLVFAGFRDDSICFLEIDFNFPGLDALEIIEFESINVMMSASVYRSKDPLLWQTYQEMMAYHWDKFSNICQKHLAILSDDPACIYNDKATWLLEIIVQPDLTFSRLRDLVKEIVDFFSDLIRRIQLEIEFEEGNIDFLNVEEELREYSRCTANVQKKDFVVRLPVTVYERLSSFPDINWSELVSMEVEKILASLELEKLIDEFDVKS